MEKKCKKSLYWFVEQINISRYGRYTSLGVIFAERFRRTIRDLLKRPVFEKGDVKLFDILTTITKQYNNTIHSSTQWTPIEASLKKNQRYSYPKLLNNRKKTVPKFKTHDLVRTADLNITFSERDTIIWSYKLYKFTETIKDTIPSYRIDD